MPRPLRVLISDCRVMVDGASRDAVWAAGAPPRPARLDSPAWILPPPRLIPGPARAAQLLHVPPACAGLHALCPSFFPCAHPSPSCLTSSLHGGRRSRGPLPVQGCSSSSSLKCLKCADLLRAAVEHLISAFTSSGEKQRRNLSDAVTNQARAAHAVHQAVLPAACMPPCQHSPCLAWLAALAGTSHHQA